MKGAESEACSMFLQFAMALFLRSKIYIVLNLPSVLVIGGTTFDHIVCLLTLPDGTPTTIHKCHFRETTGSTGTGKAVALHMLGVPTHLISACGNDTWGAQIESYLQSQQLSFDLFDDPAGTERHINLMDANGKLISIFVTNSSENISLTENYLQLHLDKHDVIVLNIIAYCRPWAAQVAACGKPVWTDLHDYDGTNTYHQTFVDAAQYIHLSSDNLTDYRAVMERFVSMGKKLVVCTHGKAGATLLSPNGGWIDVEAETVEVVDTNGAGDSFFAGFQYGWLQQEPLHTCMQYGTRAAALCVQSPFICATGLNPHMLDAIQ